MTTSIYVEHPKGRLLDLAYEFGAQDTEIKCSGNWYSFPKKTDALAFLWRIRNMTARYVEIPKDLEPDLVKLVVSKGYSPSIKGLVSKVLDNG